MSRDRSARSGRLHRRGSEIPHLALVRAPQSLDGSPPLAGSLVAATYNVHRWSGLTGRRKPDPRRAFDVLAEVNADLIALQEVLRPYEDDDPLEAISAAFGLHVAFGATRLHRRGQIGNAILSRWPILGVTLLDLSLNRIEKRVAVGVHVGDGTAELGAVAVHLALADRTRRRQVDRLLEHPRLDGAPALLLGDMNAWRNCAATRALAREMDEHHNREWPASFPATRPVLSLDRIYGRGLRIVDLSVHRSDAARRASDHLPVVARVEIPAETGR